MHLWQGEIITPRRLSPTLEPHPSTRHTHTHPKPAYVTMSALLLLHASFFFFFFFIFLMRLAISWEQKWRQTQNATCNIWQITAKLSTVKKFNEHAAEHNTTYCSWQSFGDVIAVPVFFVEVHGPRVTISPHSLWKQASATLSLPLLPRDPRWHPVSEW